MLFNWFDHALFEAWLEARLRAELHREDAATPNDRPFQLLEVPVIESLPDVAREAIERAPIHSLDQAARALDNDCRNRGARPPRARDSARPSAPTVT
jgi:hypothetical protein